jgi:hypothetical protein
MKAKPIPVEMCREQVQNLLKFIDAAESEPVKNNVFSQLGQECFYARKLDQWIEPYTGDVQAFLDWVNIQHASKYWESLKFDEDRTILTLTGRIVQGCACAFADCTQPPLSLCLYCCKNFQQALFGRLLGRKVEVTRICWVASAAVPASR